MTFKPTSELLGEAFERALAHWRRQRTAELSLPPPPVETPLVVAISRETGARGGAIARELGARLGWPVYDRNLLDLVAERADLRAELLESVDEKHKSWVVECLEALSGTPAVSESAYLTHLVQVLRSLSAHGNCVIVGRGAAVFLPAATTLRVRIVAPLECRVAHVARLRQLSERQAAEHVARTDQERSRFVRMHFHKDVADAHSFDLVLNSARYSDAHCAELIAAALERLQAGAREGAGVR